ncbi:MAG: beta-N-acetylhexosaminidase [Kiritimatiellia bacterium]
MHRFKVNIENAPAEIRAGLREIEKEYPGRFTDGRSGLELRFEKDLQQPGLAVTKQKNIFVRYHRKTDAFRALGRLLGEEPGNRVNFEETPRFDMIGVMNDVSRNAVIRPGAYLALLRRYALMGLNTAMLYTEDTYEVPGEPFFGYLRGRYSQQELRELDTYASLFGIEMFPCIQTLAHLEEILQWPAFAEYMDTGAVLIAEEKKTYELLQKMIAAASSPFKSKRIHIGMDEAHGIGSGRYRQRHGVKSPFEILNSHLAHVRDICSKLGLKPMIWSDMYFRLGCQSHDYYDPSAKVPPEVARNIPRDIQLVYWDYYHLDKKFYSDFIDRHRALGSEPVMAAGAWTWSRFWAMMSFTFNATDACMAACREKGLREAFMTIWGDSGAECDFFSALPCLQRFAEHAYAGKVDPVRLRENFRGSCGADFDDWVRASEIDAGSLAVNPHSTNGNVSQWLLWQDPFLAIMDPNLEGINLRQHYEKLAHNLALAARKGSAAGRLEFPAAIAAALSLKVNLRRDLAKAYAAGDRARLQRILKTDLAHLRRAVRALWQCHRAMWMETYKPFGWEVIDRRYGGLMARLDSVSARLGDFLAGRIESISELEAKLERVYDFKKGIMPNMGWSRVVTPSTIK